MPSKQQIEQFLANVDGDGPSIPVCKGLFTAFPAGIMARLFNSEMQEKINAASSKGIQRYYKTLPFSVFQPSDHLIIDQYRDDLDSIMEQHDGDIYGGLDAEELQIVEEYEELLRTQFNEEDFADEDGAGEFSISSSPSSHAITAVARSMLKLRLGKRAREIRAQTFVYYIRGISCGAKVTHQVMDMANEKMMAVQKEIQQVVLQQAQHVADVADGYCCISLK